MFSGPVFGRVLTALVTPMHGDGSLDLDGVQKLAAHLVDDGNDGLVVNGTTGESPTTSDAEKLQVLRAVLAAVGDRARVVAGVGTSDTAHTVELARAAAAAGAHGLLVVAPYYNKPPQEGLLAHFTAVADATDLPVMLYDIPGRTGIPITTPTLLRLAEHPRIVAVKDAKGDLFAASEVMAATDLQWYSGDDALNLAHLAQGAVGIVSVVAHVASRPYADLVAAVQDSDLPRAIAIHRALIPAVLAVMTPSQGAVMAKAGLRELGLLADATVRLPLVSPTPDKLARLRHGLADSGLL
ncbi:MAG TPA: 4-hydroxy-tetrahydrodipicolinate synthase [Dermatophilaceae bacterium]|nr:4-hydroxy-tetrahydrodipicolinate synthase [Dermatophilaceae bacterium]